MQLYVQAYVVTILYLDVCYNGNSIITGEKGDFTLKHRVSLSSYILNLIATMKYHLAIIIYYKW